MGRSAEGYSRLLIIWLLQQSTRCCAKTESAPLELAVCLSNQIIRSRLDHAFTLNGGPYPCGGIPTVDVIRQLQCAVKGAGLQRVKLPPGNWVAPLPLRFVAGSS